MELELQSLSTLAQAGSTGIGIVLVLYMYLKDKLLQGERDSFIEAVKEFTELAGRMHSTNTENRNVIEKNNEVIKENTRVIDEFIKLQRK